MYCDVKEEDIVMNENEYITNEKEMMTNLINEYANLQRIKNADDMNAEIEFQISVLKCKLQSFGIDVGDLDY